jgi:hypothetical protein
MRLSGEEFNHLEQLSAQPEYAHYHRQVTVMIQRQPSNNRWVSKR